MKSIKPGRGPSMMNGILSVLVALFGLLWTLVAVRMGGGFFALFGVGFILAAILQAVRQFRNAIRKNRESVFDLVDELEEPDPLNERFGPQRGTMPPPAGSVRYCPYCGAQVQEDYSFCSSCGRQLPGQ